MTRRGRRPSTTPCPPTPPTRPPGLRRRRWTRRRGQREARPPRPHSASARRCLIAWKLPMGLPNWVPILGVVDGSSPARGSPPPSSSAASTVAARSSRGRPHPVPRCGGPASRPDGARPVSVSCPWPARPAGAFRGPEGSRRRRRRRPPRPHRTPMRTRWARGGRTARPTRTPVEERTVPGAGAHARQPTASPAARRSVQARAACCSSGEAYRSAAAWRKAPRARTVPA